MKLLKIRFIVVALLSPAVQIYYEHLVFRIPRRQLLLDILSQALSGR